jgi:hypothetical protein
VYSSNFSLDFDSILSPKYFILKVIKHSFNPNVRTATGERQENIVYAETAPYWKFYF